MPKLVFVNQRRSKQQKNAEHIIKSRDWLYGYETNGEIRLEDLIDRIADNINYDEYDIQDNLKKLESLIAQGVNLDVQFGGFDYVPLERMFNVYFNHRGHVIQQFIFTAAQLLLDAGANPQLVDMNDLAKCVVNADKDFPRGEDQDFAAAYIALLLHYGAEFKINSDDQDEEEQLSWMDIEDVKKSVLKQYNLMVKEAYIENIDDIGEGARLVWAYKNDSARLIQKMFRDKKKQPQITFTLDNFEVQKVLKLEEEEEEDPKAAQDVEYVIQPPAHENTVKTDLHLLNVI